MMTWDARKRPSAREMLQHPWIMKDGVAGSNVIEPEVLQRLRAFANMNALKKHTLTVSGRAGPFSTERLGCLFAAVWWAPGSVPCASCWTMPSAVFNYSRLRCLAKDHKALSLAVSVFSRRCCRLRLQFVAQHMSADEVKGLREMFESMDTDHSGTISLDELREGLKRRGVAVPEALLQQIMELADLNHNR